MYFVLFLHFFSKIHRKDKLVNTFMCAVIDLNTGQLELCEFFEMTKNHNSKTT